MLYCAYMWIPFFRRRKKDEPKKGRAVKRLVAGLIIGGAIGSIVGKHLVDQKHKENGTEGELEEDEE